MVSGGVYMCVGGGGGGQDPNWWNITPVRACGRVGRCKVLKPVRGSLALKW